MWSMCVCVIGGPRISQQRADFFHLCILRLFDSRCCASPNRSAIDEEGSLLRLVVKYIIIAVVNQAIKQTNLYSPCMLQANPRCMMAECSVCAMSNSSVFSMLRQNKLASQANDSPMKALADGANAMSVRY